MSLGSLQYQQQHPLLAAASGNNYALNGLSRGNHHINHHHPQHHQPYRPVSEAVYTSSGHSGYGVEPSDGYEYGGGAPVHIPSGGSNSYHTTGAGTGYGPPPHQHQPHPQPYAQHPHPHPQPHPHQYPQPYQQHSSPATAPSTDSDKKKRFGSSSSLTALTLLSFFFFVNLLQTCLKEHMDSMNPTVMVMTAGGVRNRFNKLAEMNSREQTTSPASTTAFSSGANIVVQPADLVAAAAAVSAGVAAAAPTVKLQSPYSNNKPAFHYNSNNHNQQEPQQHPAPFSNANRDPHPEFYESAHSYPNRTAASSYNNNNNHHHQFVDDEETSPQRPTYHHSHASDAYPWSYGAAASSSSSATSYRRGGPSSSFDSHSSLLPSSTYTHVAGSKYFDNDDRYGDSYYTRIN